MPKRARETSQELIERYQRKIKKLEVEQKRKCRRIVIESSSESDETPMDPQSPTDAGPDGDCLPDDAAEASSMPTTSATESMLTAVTEASTGTGQELDPQVLIALGEHTDSSPKFGEKIHHSLAQRWAPILKKGLPKEAKDKLFKEYLVPENCTLLQAPKLNNEVAAGSLDAVRQRDKRKESDQQQLGVGISAVNKALTLMLTSDDKIEAIRIISDACRILTDLHYLNTQGRINVINYALAKPFLNVVQDSERDDTLYGNKLAEKIKAYKAIEKQGLSIKRIPKPQKGASPTEQAGPSTRLQYPYRQPSTYQGNWSGPPRFQQNRGGGESQGERATSRTASRHSSRRRTRQARTNHNTTCTASVNQMLSFTAMEEFDFNAPIDATVIFDDDSDEETNASTEKIQYRSKNGSSASLSVNDLITQGKDILSRLSETVDRIQTFGSTEYNVNVLETTNNCYAVAKGNGTNEAKSKEKPLDMPSLEEETAMTLPVNTVIMPHSNNNQTDTQNNIHCLKQQKRKLSTYEKKPKRRRTTEKKSTEDYNNNAKISKPSANTAENNQPNSHSYNQPRLNTQITLSQPQIQNKEIEQQYTINIEASPISTKYFNQQQLNPEVPLSQPLNDQSVLSNYLKELLNTVSEHMIYIVNSYHSYVRICKHCRDQSLIEHARNNYIRTKKHFFDLSYSSVLNIIIPKEADVTFVKSFLDATLNIAVSKSYNYTYIHVEPLFIEMIDWVKKRRDFIQKMDLNKIPNPLLVQQLQKPPLSIPPTLPPPAYPGLEQQIHKPNTAMNRNNILNTSMPLSQNLYTESLYNNQNGSSTIQTQNTEGYENQATYHFCQNGNFQSVIVRNEQQQQNYYNAQKMVPCEKQTPQLWEKEGTHPWQMQAWQKQLTQETGQKQATQQTWQKQVTQQSWQKQATQQSSQKQAAVPWQNPGNLPTIQSFQRFQQADLTVNNQYVAAENQVEMNIRSSISRDSGFISPLNFSTSEQSLHQEEERLQVTPFITHVTSLNPNASYITEGSCTVCGKSTKKKCLGCYKCYYCSHNCQYLDWKNHMAVCK